MSGAPRLRVVVVDDHHLFRAGVRAELASHHDVVGEAGRPAEALAVVTDAAPDLVLLDVHLPDADGFAVAAELTAGAGGPAVIITSSHSGSDYGSLV